MRTNRRNSLKWPRFLTTLAIVPVASVLWVGCEATEATEYVAGVTTQIQVPKDIRSIRIDITPPGGANSTCYTYDVDPVTGTVRLPSTHGLVSSKDPSLPVTLTVTGFYEPLSVAGPQIGDCLVSPSKLNGDLGARILRRARQPYVPSKILYLPMPLRYACYDKKCEDGETCVGGECRTADLDPAKLVEYSDAIFKGDSNQCFSASQCMAAKAPATVLDAASCKFALPEGIPIPEGSGLNVRIVHDNFSVEQLDLDPDEGFTIPDATKPREFQLAAPLCASRYKTGKIFSVEVSPLCRTKSPFNPLCTADADAAMAGDTAYKDICSVGAQLEPSPSALLVLMDRTQSMASAFTDSALQTVLGLTLADPVFRSTYVGFRFLEPASGASHCPTDSSYADATKLDVPFTLAELAKTAIAGKIKDATLIPNGALNMDAALTTTGAFALLAAPRPSDMGTKYNRRAVMLIGNSFAAGCGNTNPWATAARVSEGTEPGTPRANAYAILLPKSGAVTPAQQAAEVATATAFATDSKATLFNGIDNPAAGAEAINTVVAELGSCLYEKFAVDIPQPAKTTLSYYDRITQKRVDVAYNAACGTSNSTASGWALDDDKRVKVCGDACTSLRATTKNLGLLSLSQKQTSPGVGIRLNQPCPVSTGTP